MKSLHLLPIRTDNLQSSILASKERTEEVKTKADTLDKILRSRAHCSHTIETLSMWFSVTLQLLTRKVESLRAVTINETSLVSFFIRLKEASTPIGTAQHINPFQPVRYNSQRMNILLMDDDNIRLQHN